MPKGRSVGKTTDITNYEIDQIVGYIKSRHGVHVCVKTGFDEGLSGRTLVVAVCAWRALPASDQYEYQRGKSVTMLLKGVPLVTATWRALFDLARSCDSDEWHVADWNWILQIT